MKITATYKTANVTIVNINVIGQMQYTSYVDGAGALKTETDWLDPTETVHTIATGATVVS